MITRLEIDLSDPKIRIGKGINFIPPVEFLKKVMNDAPACSERVVIKPSFYEVDQLRGYFVEYMILERTEKRMIGIDEINSVKK